MVILLTNDNYIWGTDYCRRQDRGLLEATIAADQVLAKLIATAHVLNLGVGAR